MSISNLNELQKDKLFSALVELQAVLDDLDPVLRQSGMTRAPIHALAFLIIWQGLEGRDDKEVVIKKLGELAGQYFLLGHPENITIEALDALCANIHWPKIINETLAEGSHNTALKVNIEVPQVEAFLNQIKKVDPKLHRVLVDKQLVQKSDNPSKAVVTTTVQQKVSWCKALEAHQLYDSSDNLIWGWKVPDMGCQFSQSLIKKLDEITTSGRYGNFEIKVGDSGNVNVWIRVDAKNAQDAKNQILKFNFEEQEVNSGIYDVFLSTKLAGMYLPIGSIIVKLACESAMDRHGAEVKQKQRVEILETCCRNFKRPTEIIVDMVALFNDAGIQVPLTNNRCALKDIPWGVDDVIRLRTKDAAQWVTCLPATYSACEHFYKGRALTPEHAATLEGLQNKGTEASADKSLGMRGF